VAKSINCEAPHYVIVSILLFLPPSYVQIFLSALCSQVPSAVSVLPERRSGFFQSTCSSACLVGNLVPSVLCSETITVTHFQSFSPLICFAGWVYNVRTDRSLGANWSLRKQVMLEVQCLWCTHRWWNTYFMFLSLIFSFCSLILFILMPVFSI
jgi:hypothetical protein